MFRFVSNGQADHIYKLIRFTPTNHQGIVNLAFGDSAEKSDDINDKANSANGDMPLVLATVAASIYVYARENPDVWVFLTGSTPARTRLYRMAISNYWHDIEPDFDVLALGADGWEPFVKGRNYEAFVVRKKAGSNFDEKLPREKWAGDEGEKRLDEGGEK